MKIEVKLNFKVLEQVLVRLSLTVLFSLAVWLMIAAALQLRQEVQILTWSPSEDSPYICLVAVKGPEKIEALSCLLKVEE